MTDLTTRFLIAGAGMTGLAFANFIDDPDLLIVEREQEIGGWCKTVYQDDFVWDYSGHFFHFKNPEIDAYLRQRMPDDTIVTVEKNAQIYIAGRHIDFPFQKNIHQLPKQLFIDCLYDLYFRDNLTEGARAGSFKAMLYEKFGRSISELFLIPYNEKLYACDLDELDRDAMGRFFPHADIDEILRNMRHADNLSYNATFTYPLDGAIRYVEALARQVDANKIITGDGITSLDLKTRTATLASGRTVRYEYLISSIPFDRLLTTAGLEHHPEDFTSNKVLVFNLGFDKKGPQGVHWIYFPQRDLSFYRVGFYDNIMDAQRMSLYVEIGLPTEAPVDVESARRQVLQDLSTVGIIDAHQLISHHHVILNPAYVHITTRSRQAHQDLSQTLAMAGVYSIGRYGGWTYCSIEDNIIEARALARRFNRLDQAQ